TLFRSRGGGDGAARWHAGRRLRLGVPRGGRPLEQEHRGADLRDLGVALRAAVAAAPRRAGGGGRRGHDRVGTEGRAVSSALPLLLAALLAGIGTYGVVAGVGPGAAAAAGCPGGGHRDFRGAGPAARRAGAVRRRAAARRGGPGAVHRGTAGP